jgi:hypothetical protein
MIRLGISPSSVAKAAFKREVKRREEKERLQPMKSMDPRLTMDDLRRRSRRVKRLLGE